MKNSVSLQEIRCIQALFPDRWEQIFAMLESLEAEAKREKMRELLNAQAAGVAN
ncbi:MAG: hypothetical protein ACM3YO_08755 [Bacteroidota bacterium]